MRIDLGYTFSFELANDGWPNYSSTSCTEQLNSKGLDKTLETYQINENSRHQTYVCARSNAINRTVDNLSGVVQAIVACN